MNIELRIENKEKQKIYNSETGQSLIEVVVALGAAVIIITAITSSIMSALNNSQFSKSQNLATAYAQEGIEIIKRMKESDWATFNALNNDTYCMSKLNPTTLTPKGGFHCPQNIDNFFIREVEIQRNSASCPYSDGTGTLQSVTEATVTIKWYDTKCKSSAVQDQYCRRVTLVTCVTNLQGVPAL